MDFLNLPWAEIAGIAALIILAGERIAKLTPTKTDNKILQAVRKVAKTVGLDFPDVD